MEKGRQKDRGRDFTKRGAEHEPGPSSAAVKDGNDPVYCNGQSMVGSPFVPFAIILLFPNE